MLSAYENAIGQKVNVNNSRIFFLKDLCVKFLDIKRILGFKVDHLRSFYLGMQLIDCRTLELEWGKVVSRIQDKLASWKG